MKKLALLIVALGWGQAWAVPIQWTLNNVALEECSGAICDTTGSVTGSFVYDADTNTYSDIALAATPGVLGPGWGGITYTGDNWNPDHPGFEDDAISAASAGGITLAGSYVGATCPGGPCQNVLTLAYAANLTNAGGVIALSTSGASFENLNVATAGPNIAQRSIISGTLTGVSVIPIPAAIWLFGTALAALGLTRRAQFARV